MALGTLDSVDFMIDAVFFRTDRQDATLVFSTDAAAGGAARRSAACPACWSPSPISSLPVNAQQRPLRAAALDHRQAAGDRPQPRPRPRSQAGDAAATPASRSATASPTILHVSAGDIVRVEFLDGARRTVEVPVTQVIQSYHRPDGRSWTSTRWPGSPARPAHLRRPPRDRRRPARRALRARSRTRRQIAAVALQSRSRQRFQETMQENIDDHARPSI